MLYLLLKDTKNEVLKRASRRLLLKYADKPPEEWYEFLKEKYEGGKKKVPNTNTDGLKKEVSVSYLLQKDQNFRKKIQNEYKQWLGSKKQQDLFKKDLERDVDDKDYKDTQISNYLEEVLDAKVDLKAFKNITEVLYGKGFTNSLTEDDVSLALYWEDEPLDEDAIYNKVYDRKYEQYINNGEDESDAEEWAGEAAQEAVDKAWDKWESRSLSKFIEKSKLKYSDIEDFISLMGVSAFKDIYEVPELEFRVVDGSLEMRLEKPFDSVSSLNRTITGNTLHNDLFIMDSGFRGGGSGSSVFASQVYHAKRCGLKYIKCNAARGGSYVGYKVWPKLGYDGEISEEYSNRIPSSILGQFKLLGIHEPYKLSHLYNLPDNEGVDWWEEHGGSIDVSFNLSDDSYSMRTLAAYLASKADRKKQEGEDK